MATHFVTCRKYESSLPDWSGIEALTNYVPFLFALYQLGSLEMRKQAGY